MEKSLYSNYNWMMTLSSVPDMQYIVRTDLPAINCPPTMIRHHSGIVYPLMGEIIEYDPGVITIQVDEFLKSYFSIQSWFVSLRNPEQEKSHKRDNESKANILLEFRSNQGGPGVRVMFFDVKPTSISALPLDVQADETNPITFDLGFVYSYFKRLNDSEVAEGFGSSIS